MPKAPFVLPIFLILVPKPVAAQMLALSVKTFERLVQSGDFPKPRQLSAGRVGWLVRELNEWAEAQPVSALLPPANTGAKIQV